MSREDHAARVRTLYDLSAERYVQFVGTEISSATEGPLDQSLLSAFAELVKRGSEVRVADLGCGPGRVAAFLAERSLNVVGVDVSPAMVAVARQAHPHIEFEEGQLDTLPIGDAVLAGAVCWYSIIYTPPDLLGEAFAELARVLMSGGYVLLAFQAGSGELQHQPDAHRTKLSLGSYRHNTDGVIRQLNDAGLPVYATTLREPQLEHETTAQAFVIARKR